MRLAWRRPSRAGPQVRVRSPPRPMRGSVWAQTDQRQRQRRRGIEAELQRRHPGPTSYPRATTTSAAPPSTSAGSLVSGAGTAPRWPPRSPKPGRSKPTPPKARLMLSTSTSRRPTPTLGRLFAERDVAERVAGRAGRDQQAGQPTGWPTAWTPLASSARPRPSPLQGRADVAALDEQIALTRNQLAALIGAGPDRGLAIARPSRIVNLKPLGVPGAACGEPGGPPSGHRCSAPGGPRPPPCASTRRRASLLSGRQSGRPSIGVQALHSWTSCSAIRAPTSASSAQPSACRSSNGGRLKAGLKRRRGRPRRSRSPATTPPSPRPSDQVADVLASRPRGAGPGRRLARRAGRQRRRLPDRPVALSGRPFDLSLRAAGRAGSAATPPHRRRPRRPRPCARRPAYPRPWRRLPRRRPDEFY